MRRKSPPPAYLISLPMALILSVSGAILAPAWADSGASRGQEEQKAPSAPPSTPQSAAAEGQPDAEGWLFDEERKRRYRIETLPKVEGAYQWIDEDRVRMPAGVDFQVVKHDEKTFWVKYYEPRRKPRITRKKEEGPSPEEIAAITATYEFELPETDRLRFEAFDRGLPKKGQWRNGFDIEDMNGDGHLDLVFGPSRKGRAVPNIFLGDSQGGWQRWKVRFPNLSYDYGDAEAADFNADGRMDIAFGIHLRGMLVLVNDGKGGFEPWSEGIGIDQLGSGRVGSSFSSRAVESVDWNDDGKLDVIALGEGPKGTSGRQGQPGKVVDNSRDFLVYLNKGDGSWARWRPLQDPNILRPDFGDSFVITDLDGDSFRDLVASSRQMNNRLILRRGIDGGKVTMEKVEELRPRGLVTSVAAADLDGDSFEDLVIGYNNRELNIWRTGIDILYGGKDRSWRRHTLVNEESRRGVTALAVGELDGDGRKDLVALTGDGAIFVFLADPKTAFVHEKEELMPVEAGCQGFGLRLLDFDGDGRDEMVASFAGETSGMPGLPGLHFPGCTDSGSVRAWKSLPAS